eukprot:CAMPEP_0117431262 /NCGR_PEP_ID=MMETSP0758-20121206/10803_1 /TAXON_ID=63605 /ORGANISM="Percolomonas cosmopolitus, Strain AE-1 (ATCC 50343)" /LENGTH=179 /DNA_ID=CAMNT_0005220109 /DNA_START=215 /DNA_END=750 /DNA_ORIENTATION=+
MKPEKVMDICLGLPKSAEFILNCLNIILMVVTEYPLPHLYSSCESYISDILETPFVNHHELDIIFECFISIASTKEFADSMKQTFLKSLDAMMKLVSLKTLGSLCNSFRAATILESNELEYVKCIQDIADKFVEILHEVPEMTPDEIFEDENKSLMYDNIVSIDLALNFLIKEVPLLAS